MNFNLVWEGVGTIHHSFSLQIGKPYVFVSPSLSSLRLKALFSHL